MGGTYNLTDLGPNVRPYGVNNNGQAVGRLYTSGESGGYCFIWDAPTGIRMVASASTLWDMAAAINEAGAVAGYTGLRAWIWDSANGLRDLGVLPGHSWSNAFDINDHNQVTGGSGPSGNYSGCISGWYPYVWDEATGMTAIPKLPGIASATGTAITNQRVVSGDTECGWGGIFLWDAFTGTLPLVDPILRPSTAYGVCRATGVFAGNVASRPALWDADRVITYLGPPDARGWAEDVNADGLVVGRGVAEGTSQAVIWGLTSVTALKSLVPSSAGWSFFDATGVTDDGVIVGWGSLGGTPHGFVLTPANRPPVAEDQAVSTDEDTAVGITLTASDVDADSLTYSVESQPAHGTLSGTAPNVTYTPQANYHGADSFTFRASDGELGSNLATVSLTVNPVNDAPVCVDDVAVTDEDAVVTIDVLRNDSDVDGDTLSTGSVTQSANGAIVINGDTVAYTPNADWNGTDTFTYTASDGNGGTGTATVTVTVEPVNDDPVAEDDGVRTDEDVAVMVDVLADDTDVDGDTLAIDSVTQPANGAVVINDDNVEYTPNADWNGTDTFTYAASDGNGGTDTATVAVTVEPVNDKPVAEDDLALTNEDTPVVVDVLVNDSDVDGDNLTISIVGDPLHGSATRSNGTIEYSPDPDYDEPDSFTYTVDDGHGGTDTATVNIVITPVNDKPIADPQSAQTDEDATVDITLTGSDVEGDELTFSVVEGPVNGSLSGTPPQVTYTPNADYNGSDSFTFKVSDGDLDSETATVTIQVDPVNDAPVLGPITAPVDPVQVSMSIAATAPFSDVDQGDSHTALWEWGDGTSSAGTVDQAAGLVTGDHTYSTPGVYTIVLTLTDEGGLSDEAAYHYVVVYNPDGGFVTGGGWISSPAGAYAADPALAGKATFGFNSKYKQGASTPSGQTEFQFKVASLNFHSETYDWLVVAGCHAKYKGVGTINGAGNYGFMLTATDGQISGGGGIDRFRIKIWDKDDADALVYDNQMGEGDDSYAGTELSGGSIVIHKGDSVAALSSAGARITSASAAPTPTGAQVTFALSVDADVSATVLNIAGRPVRTLCTAKAYSAGTSTLLWNAQSDVGLRVPSGVYLVRVTAHSPSGAQSTALTTVRLAR